MLIYTVLYIMYHKALKSVSFKQVTQGCG